MAGEIEARLKALDFALPEAKAALGSYVPFVHLDHLLFSEKGIPHAYVPDHAVEMAFLGSNTAGDWAVGDFWGPLGNETRAWLDHLATGAPTVHTKPEQARINLETTIAIERAVASGQPVRLPLQMEE